MNTVTRVQVMEEVVCASLMSQEKQESMSSPSSYVLLVGQTRLFRHSSATGRSEQKKQMHSNELKSV